MRQRHSWHVLNLRPDMTLAEYGSDDTLLRVAFVDTTVAFPSLSQNDISLLTRVQPQAPSQMLNGLELATLRKMDKYQPLANLLHEHNPSVEYVVFPLVTPSLPCGYPKLLEQLKALRDFVSIPTTPLISHISTSVARSNHRLWIHRAKFLASMSAALPNPSARAKL